MDRAGALLSPLVPAAAAAPVASSADDGIEFVRCGGMQGEVVAEWREAILGGDGLPVQRWLREGRATAVKRGAGRTVYRVDLPHRSFFVKHLRDAGLLRSVKALFRTDACRREFDKARELARRHVPAVIPIALGLQKRGWWGKESFLVTEAVPAACSLDEYVDDLLPRLPHPQRVFAWRRLLDAAAQLCAAAHEGGVFHDDLHGGNILVRRATAALEPHYETSTAADAVAAPQLFLVDLPGIRLTGPLDEARSRESLAMICAGFANRMSDADRVRFWRTYLAARPSLAVDDAWRSACAVREAAVRHGRRIVRQRDKRAWADNRDFYRLHGTSGTAHAVRELPRTMVEQLLRTPERLWQDNIDRPVKLSHGSLVVEAELTLADRTIPVAVKRLRPKSLGKALGLLFRRGRAPEAWYRGHALLARGIPTARPLVVYQPAGAKLFREGFLLTEWLTGAQDMHLYGWDLATRAPRERTRRARAAAAVLGRLVGRLHDQGFQHRDLKGNNLLLRDRGEDVEAFLIDLDGLRQRRRVPFAACTKGLTRLAVSAEMHPWLSRTDRLRFLQAYLRQMAENRRTWKTWWRAIGATLAAALVEIRAAGKPIA